MKTTWTSNLTKFLKRYNLTLEEYMKTNVVEEVCMNRVAFLINETPADLDVFEVKEGDDIVYGPITVEEFRQYLINCKKNGG